LNPLIGIGIDPVTGRGLLLCSGAESQMHLHHTAILHLEEGIISGAAMPERD
jgi:hypothetical protein